jgi:hypothetical protein
MKKRISSLIHVTLVEKNETPGHDNTKGQSKSVFGHGKSHQLVIAGKEVHGSSLGLGDALWL